MNNRRLALAVGLIALAASSGRLMGQGQEPVDENWERLRELFFTVTPEQVEIRPTEVPTKVFGVLMDWHIPIAKSPGTGVVLTVWARADGTSSVYTSKGVVIIGGDAAPKAAKAFFHEAELRLHTATPAVAHPAPPVGMVRFFIRTFDGLRVIKGRAADINSVFSTRRPLFQEANRLVSELRQIAEKKLSAASAPK